MRMTSAPKSARDFPHIEADLPLLYSITFIPSKEFKSVLSYVLWLFHLSDWNIWGTRCCDLLQAGLYLNKLNLAMEDTLMVQVGSDSRTYSVDYDCLQHL